MIEITNSVYLAFYLYLILILVQWGVATVSKARRAGAVPGKLDENLSHQDFIFRAHRTFHNTIENSPLFIGTVLLALQLNYQSPVFAISIWTYLLARVIHMVLYYRIATEKNPSPRSYFFILGVVANIVMLVQIGLGLI